MIVSYQNWCVRLEGSRNKEVGLPEFWQGDQWHCTFWPPINSTQEPQIQ